VKFSVYWLEFAENKLDDIYGYYSEKAGQRIATEIVIGIIDATLTLQVQPKIGQVEHLLQQREEDFRYLVFKNYKIIYWINAEARRIEIINVFDTRQNPKKLRQTRR